MLISFKQLFLFVIEAHVAALYKSFCYIAAFHIKDIAIADNDVGIFTYFQGTGLSATPRILAAFSVIAVRLLLW
jgi:hypothetical protein